MAETDEQKALFSWAKVMENQYPELKLMYHVPNEAKRSYGLANRLRAEGMKSGVPDVCLPVSRCGYHGAYIEMKYGKNKLSEAQVEWLSNLQGQNYLCAVCYSWESASNIIEAYIQDDLKSLESSKDLFKREKITIKGKTSTKKKQSV